MQAIIKPNNLHDSVYIAHILHIGRTDAHELKQQFVEIQPFPCGFLAKTGKKYKVDISELRLAWPKNSYERKSVFPIKIIYTGENVNHFSSIIHEVIKKVINSSKLLDKHVSINILFDS